MFSLHDFILALILPVLVGCCTERLNWTELNWRGLVFDELTNGQEVMHYSRPVFFNLFAAAEPYTNVKVTHGTPCIDLWVMRQMLEWSYRVSTDSFP